VEKNAQYATAEDALLNYRQAAAAGVSTPQAVFARLADKHGRLALVAKGAAKLNRSDIRDALNILVQLEAACVERGDLE
jgi:DNA polymerase III delta subunit